jgi:NAD(P)-dependent dehydrogenase (short-subunit alcohol dehydrogenase family)
MPSTLEGKVAVITGAGSGMGRAMAELFCDEGASVVAMDISGAQDSVAGSLDGQCIAVQGDVSVGEHLEVAMDTAISHFGRLDVLCNNAGFDGEHGTLVETTVENFDRVVDVNFKGVYLGIKLAIPRMLETAGGSIVNVASAGGLRSARGLAVYGAAKAAVVMLSRSVAAEYSRQGIRSNTICPGVIDTPLLNAAKATELKARYTRGVPAGRLGTADEIAAAALFLASDAASYVTGATLSVDGGMVA